MNLYDQRPKISSGVFVAPNASLIGSVEVKDCSSVWYGAVIRGDQSSVYVGGFSSVGDRTVVQVRAPRTHARLHLRCSPRQHLAWGGKARCLAADHTHVQRRSARPPRRRSPRRLDVSQSAAINPTGFSARTYIGDYVTIGQGCVLRACTVEDHSVVGDGCIIQEGALVDRNAMLEAGSLLPSGARVPSGEVYGGSPASFVRKLSKEEITEFQVGWSRG